MIDTSKYTALDWQGMIMDLRSDLGRIANNVNEETFSALEMSLDMAMDYILKDEHPEDFYAEGYAIYILNQDSNLDFPEGHVWGGDRNMLDKHNEIRARMFLPPLS